MENSGEKKNKKVIFKKNIYKDIEVILFFHI